MCIQMTIFMSYICEEYVDEHSSVPWYLFIDETVKPHVYELRVNIQGKWVCKGRMLVEYAHEIGKSKNKVTKIF